MSKKRWIALVVAICLFIISIVSQIQTTVAMSDFGSVFQMNNFEENVIEQGTGTEKIAVLNLQGTIQSDNEGGLINTDSYSHKKFLDMLDQAADDPAVKGVILRLNTPGGGVVESAEIHDKIVNIQENEKKPVYVSMGNTAASGGYYISAPADKIFAHTATLTGSIGVIMESINFAELADKLGIDVNTIKSGEYKDIMSPTRPMTEKEHDILQTMINELYGEFVQVIVEGREMPEDEVRKLADGRVYTGRQAKENGLVDELGTLDDVIVAMKKEYGLDNATVIEYKNSFGFSQYLTGTMQSLFGSNSDTQGIKDLIRQSDGPRAMYLYTK